MFKEILHNQLCNQLYNQSDKLKIIEFKMADERFKMADKRFKMAEFKMADERFKMADLF